MQNRDTEQQKEAETPKKINPILWFVFFLWLCSVLVKSKTLADSIFSIQNSGSWEARCKSPVSSQCRGLLTFEDPGMIQGGQVILGNAPKASRTQEFVFTKQKIGSSARTCI